LKIWKPWAEAVSETRKRAINARRMDFIIRLYIVHGLNDIGRN